MKSELVFICAMCAIALLFLVAAAALAVQSGDPCDLYAFSPAKDIPAICLRKFTQ